MKKKTAKHKKQKVNLEYQIREHLTDALGHSKSGGFFVGVEPTVYPLPWHQIWVEIGELRGKAETTEKVWERHSLEKENSALNNIIDKSN